MKNENHIISIWGSPGAGKTTLSIKIAKEMQDLKQTVAVVLCDNEIPSLPIVMPYGKMERRSLGELLSQPHLSRAEILKHSIPFGNNQNIGLLGYCIDENPQTYPDYSVTTAKSLLSALSCMVDCVVVDCSSNLVNNPLTLTALTVADTTLRVVNANLKSTVYVRSQQEHLMEPCYRYDRQTVVLNDVLPEQDENAHSAIVGEADYVIPHCPEIIEQFETGKLSEPFYGRGARYFTAAVRQIVKEVLNDAER